MSRLFHCLIAPVSALVAGSVVAETFDSSPFRFRKAIVGQVETEGIATVELDAEVFARTATDFADLRLVRRKGGTEVEVPYLVERLERRRPQEPPRTIPTAISDFEENADGSIEVVVELDEDSDPCASFEVRTPLRDFEKSVSVSGSPDGTEWTPLLDEALIFDHERYLDFRKTRLDLPANEARFLRVRVEDASDEQRSVVKHLAQTIGEEDGVSVTTRESVRRRTFRIDELVFFTARIEQEEGVNERSYPVEIGETNELVDDKRTEILLDAARAPLRALTLVTPDRNFRRAVSIQVPAPGASDSWRTIHRGRIHRFRVGDFHDERTTLEFDGQRSDRYRVLVENEDSPPLSFEGVEAKGDIHQLQYLAEPSGAAPSPAESDPAEALPEPPGAEWEIYYGTESGAVRKPRYDTAALLAARGRDVATVPLSLDAQRENESFSPGAAGVPWTERKWILWLVIALVVVTLAGVLVRTAGRIEDV
ncbi:MAG: DUF3999 family protein [Verrucomicrobiales bacterium]